MIVGLKIFALIVVIVVALAIAISKKFPIRRKKIDINKVYHAFKEETPNNMPISVRYVYNVLGVVRNDLLRNDYRVLSNAKSHLQHCIEEIEDIEKTLKLKSEKP